MKNLPRLLSLSCVATVWAQVQPFGVTRPIVEDCGFNGTVVCVNKYAAVLPYHFNRSISNSKVDYDFRNTSDQNATTLDLLDTANFVVFDRQRGLQYLGPNPSYEFMFAVSPAVHEAPVYAPKQNLLFLSQLAPPTGQLPQLVVDLNQNPPTLNEYLPNPPIYAPNGGTFRNGLIIFGASGGNDSLGGIEQRISIRTVDPATNSSTVLLNNYFGFYFNTIDDLSIHPTTKDIFFTDPYYSWYNGLTDTAPQLPAASYRFDPETGAVFLIDDSLEEPNGIAFSPDGKTLYISDTGAVSGTIDPRLGSQGATFNTTGKRTIYAFDVTSNGTRVSNKRAFYLAQDWVPDGLKVSREGLVLTGSGHGVDILDDVGQLLIRIQTNYTVQNFAWTGQNLSTLWMMGNNGISRVQFNITGQTLT
ncbi:gluconolactonase [Capronia coronata CBS 617.96]|uniref:Gluconolactonase n=1 Tax=Capronia coronata CBS 617.96 TaxID=1182541 RepID=W9YMT6_9EURO|nr:gluconolactonase [Capronia coronata CBS 617.96]EXJ83584.1 gluconolactonase [Capronia coronata CBS 617.96]